jgi:DNA polymerase V
MVTHGGRRFGAGRPSGSGKYQEKTKVIRVPESMTRDINAYVENKGYQFPLYGSKVSAGFPSPADDHIEMQLDLNAYLIKHPSSTFFVRVSGESMKNAGIFPDDILLVDRSLTPTDGRVVIVALDGELTVKRLKITKNDVYLMPENPDYQPIKVNALQELNIWGVVTNVIHAL